MTSCSDDFEPLSFLKKLEVLALVQSPSDQLNLNLRSSLKIKPHVYLASEESIISSSWDICFLSTGSFGGYECALDDCSFTVSSANLPSKEKSLEIEAVLFAIS